MPTELIALFLIAVAALVAIVVAVVRSRVSAEDEIVKAEPRPRVARPAHGDVRAGLRQLERYLGHHAAFAAYLEDRGGTADDASRSTSSRT